LQLIEFSVKNYRSITNTERLHLGTYNVLIGPNNEGKSNLLRALVSAVNVLSFGAIPRRARTIHGLLRRHQNPDYDWARDYPIDKQRDEPTGQTEFRLTFALDDSDRADFEKKVGSRLSGDLALRLRFGKEGLTLYEPIIQGSAKKAWTERREQLQSFLSERIAILYIPTHRTAEQSHQIVQGIVDREMNVLLGNEAYRAAIQTMRETERRLLNSMGSKLTNTLKEFIDVQNVRLEAITNSTLRRFATRGDDIEIVVDDGTPTPLSMKGDGIQSLAAIALMKQSRVTPDRALILAVEEPESHLHPDGIHNLRRIILEVSKKHQVVLTTHSPLLVNREQLGNTIVVRTSKAKEARSLADIREALGVRLSDNLSSAEMVLLVEGVSDKRVIESAAIAWYPALKKALNEGRLVIDALDGVDKLPFKLSLYRTLMCNVHCLLDNDEQARRVLANIKDRLPTNHFHFTSCLDMKNSELEDLVKPEVYDDLLREHNLDPRKLNHSKQKWSDRLSKAAQQAGVSIAEAEIASMKAKIAERASKDPGSALIAERSECLHGLFKGLCRRLGVSDARARQGESASKPLKAAVTAQLQLPSQTAPDGL
jgi:putative ATP-dependent endonuclease of the OLD family